MAKYLFVYFGGKMSTDPKAMEKSNQEWIKWFTGMGKAMVNMGAATMPGKVVSGSGVKAASTTRSAVIRLSRRIALTRQ